MGLFDAILGLFRGSSESSGTPGPAGPSGPQGAAGPVGPPGPAGGAAADIQLIKLPVNFVLVASTLNINRLLPVRTAMTDVRAFWALQDIDIQPHISGMVADESILTFDLPSTELVDRHFWEARGGSLTVYIGWESTRVGNDLLGQTRDDGVATVAGGNAILGGGNLMADIINHELGHLLGLGAGHEEGTFMRAIVDTPNDIVTPAQQAMLKATAYELGGF